MDLAGAWCGCEPVLNISEPQSLVGKGRVCRAAVSHAAVSRNCDRAQTAEKCACPGALSPQSGSCHRDCHRGNALSASRGCV